MDFLKGFKELFIDGAIDAVRQYQSKSVDLVKIEAAAWYIRGIQLVHRQALVFALILFLVVIAAAAIVVVPFFLLTLAPWTKEAKWIVALLLGAVDITVPLLMLAHILSEKNWMQFTKSGEFIESVLNKN